MISSGFKTKQRFLLFLLLLVTPLITPWILELFRTSNLKSSYVQFSNFAGSYSVYLEMIESSQASQILVFGNSGGLSSLDINYTEDRLKSDLNQDLKVRNISITGDSVALPYLILDDLIRQNRKPELFIYQLPSNHVQYYHPSSRMLFKLTKHFDLVLNDSLSTKGFLKFYAVKALDSLSSLLHMALNWDVRLTKEFMNQTIQNKGAKFYREVELNQSNFATLKTGLNSLDKNILIRAPYEYTADQIIWYNLLEKICRENNIRLVYMIFPFKGKSYKNEKFNVARNFDPVFAKESNLMGVTRSIFESSLTPSQIKEFDKDPHHFGRDISLLHTKLLYPQILRHIKEYRGLSEK